MSRTLKRAQCICKLPKLRFDFSQLPAEKIARTCFLKARSAFRFDSIVRNTDETDLQSEEIVDHGLAFRKSPEQPRRLFDINRRERGGPIIPNGSPPRPRTGPHIQTSQLTLIAA